MNTVRSRPGKKATATRQRILDAAAHVFRQNGYTGTRLTDIAKMADTQAGSLYYHFDSREDLVREVLRVGQQRTNDFVMERVSSLGEEVSSIDRLRAATAAHLESVLSIGDYTAATLRILGQVPDDIRNAAQSLQRSYGRYWRGLFEKAQDDGYLLPDLDMNSTQMILLGAMNTTPDWFHPNQRTGLSRQGLEDQFTSVFFDGLATAQGRKRRTGAPRVSAAAPAKAVPADGTRAAATTARILDSAAKTFRENGYAGTRLLDVATGADMQTGSLYYHFDSREDLVTHLMHDAWERTDGYVRRTIQELPSRTAPINCVASAMTAHLLSVLGDGDYTSAMLRILGQVPPEVRAKIQPLQRAYLDLWRGLLRDAADAGDVRTDVDLTVVLMLITGALSWAVEWYSPTEHPAPDKLAMQFCRIVFDGISSRKRVSSRTSG